MKTLFLSLSKSKNAVTIDPDQKGVEKIVSEMCRALISWQHLTLNPVVDSVDIDKESGSFSFDTKVNFFPIPLRKDLKEKAEKFLQEKFGKKFSSIDVSIDREDNIKIQVSLRSLKKV